MTLEERFALRVPDVTDAALREEMLSAARAFVLAYTGRAVADAALEECILQLGCVYLNRMGLEGERTHAEGTVQRTLTEDLPKELRRMLNARRCVKTLAAGGA